MKEVDGLGIVPYYKPWGRRGGGGGDEGRPC